MDDQTAHRLDASNLGQRARVLGGKEVFLDKEGFLWHPEDWTEEVAASLALECGIERLSEVQWRLIRFLREYFSYHGRAPLNRDLKAGLNMSLMELECVFPEGIRRGARRVAGLPNPRMCSG